MTDISPESPTLPAVKTSPWRRGKKIVVALLKIAIVGGAFAYLLRNGQLDFGKIQSQFAHPGWVFAGIVGAFLPMVSSFYRQLLLLRALGIACYQYRDTLRIGFIGCFFSTFMPGAVGGDVIKAGYFIRDTRETAKSLASVLVDRVMGLFGLLVVGGAAIALAREQVMNAPDLHQIAVVVFGVIAALVLAAAGGLLALLRGRGAALKFLALTALLIGVGGWWIWRGAGYEWQIIRTSAAETAALAGILLRCRFILAAAIALIAALLAVAIVPSCQPGRRLSNFIHSRVPGGAALMRFVEALLIFRNDLAALGYALLLSVGQQTVNICSIYFISRAIVLPAAPGVFDIFFAAPLASIANTLPVPGGGLGVGEAVFAGVLSLCQDGAGNAIVGGATIFLAWRLWTVLLSFTGGLPYYLRGKKEIADVAGSELKVKS
ncbi:hypothetical protein FACS1894139_17980 [Planctomycetales bacterium]|nr:hypothetical protein FACS1894107_15100 [Planctomycetales bacterium]GHT00608.1 hypothetical protein FACS1894108_13060 [Planctomycetales bacterium]GHT08368.1 hypothetical protein FACS1894139_17980 [Planctomycetales bacterium]